MYPYLIECRLSDDIRHKVRHLIHDVSRRFNVMGVTRHRPVPHITMFGPFATSSIRDVIHAMKNIGLAYHRLDYRLDGFGYFEKRRGLFIPKKQKHVIYLRILPSDEMIEFRRALSKKIMPLCKVKNRKIDGADDFEFHATIAMDDINDRFDDIWKYLESFKLSNTGTCYRTSLINRKKIMCEYDFVQAKMFDRHMALRRDVWRTTRNAARPRTIYYKCPSCREPTTLRPRDFCPRCGWQVS